MFAHIEFDRDGNLLNIWYSCETDAEEATLRRATAVLFRRSFRARFAQWATRWIAGVFARLPYTQKTSNILDRLRAKIYESN